jgi:hypothetical protein
MYKVIRKIFSLEVLAHKYIHLFKYFVELRCISESTFSYKILCTGQPDIIHQLVEMKFMVFLLLSAYFAATFAWQGKIFVICI